MEKLYFKNRLNHSNSQPYIQRKSNKGHHYLLSQSSINNKNLLLPSVGNKIKKENGGGYGRAYHQSLDSSLNSSFRYSTKRSKKAFSDYIRNINYKAKKDNYKAKKKLNDIINATKKVPSYLDYKINTALTNRKLKDELEEKMKISRLKNRLDEELNRQRALDDLKFRRDINEIEAKRENIRLKRRHMLNELKNLDYDDLDSPLYLPPPPLPPPPPYYAFPQPQYYLPPMYTNNNGDSIGELVKFFLVKKLFDESKQPLIYPQYPYQYYPGYPFPFIYDPNIKKQLSKIKPFSYPVQPIIIQNPAPNPPTKKKQSINNNIITESQKGIPFVDPLEKYLDMVNRLKKSNKDDVKKAKGKKGAKNDEEDEGDGENEEEGGGEDNEGGEDGEGGDEGDGGDGDGEGGDGDGDGGDGDGGDGEGDGEGDGGEE